MNQEERDFIPNDYEAERAALGAVLQGDSQAANKLMDTIFKAEIFFHPRHQVIFQAISDLYRRHIGIDVVTVSGWLRDNNLVEKAGGPSYVTEIAAETPSTRRAEEYANMVVEKYKLRTLMQTGHEIVRLAQRKDMPAEDIVNLAEQQVLDIAKEHKKGDMVGMSEAILDTVKFLIEKAKTGGVGLPTGFDDLDDILGGLHMNDLVILAARPAMGKTAFALNIALNAAKHLKKEADREGKPPKKIMIFSLEMPVHQLMQRLISMEGQISTEDLGREVPSLLDGSEDFTRTLDVLNSLPIEIDDSSMIDIAGIRSKCAREQSEGGSGVGMVIVDYLQLMESGTDNENRQQEVSSMSRNLKLLAMWLKCPVLVLSQLSREPERRTNHRPQLSDLRESGAIEQDADVVLMLYRDFVYNGEESENPDICEVLITKHRNGPIGSVDLVWNDKFTLFRNKASQHDMHLAARHMGE